jgi:CRP-like cAMP-binding protein
MVRTHIPQSILQHLADQPLFAGATSGERRAVANLGTHVTVPDGRVLMRQGGPAVEFCLLLAGDAWCEIDGRPVADFGPGDFFGEMALLDRGRRHATVVTGGTAELLVFDPAEFSGLLATAPSVAQRLVTAYSERRRANTRSPKHGEEAAVAS